MRKSLLDTKIYEDIFQLMQLKTILEGMEKANLKENEKSLGGYGENRYEI